MYGARVSEQPATRMELVEAFIPHSPHAVALGISIEQIEADRAVLAMPFKQELVTMGDVVHGGAISTLIDTAATVSAWATDEVPESPSGATVALSVNFIAAARAVDLRAEAKVVKRGRKLSFCEVQARDPGGKLIANGIATYSF
jgi:uncharacterized protein (TIGR00369 family)